MQASVLSTLGKDDTCSENHKNYISVACPNMRTFQVKTCMSHRVFIVFSNLTDDECWLYDKKTNGSEKDSFFIITSSVQAASKKHSTDVDQIILSVWFCSLLLSWIVKPLQLLSVNRNSGCIYKGYNHVFFSAYYALC